MAVPRRCQALAHADRRHHRSTCARSCSCPKRTSALRAVSSKAALQHIPPFPFAAIRVAAAVPFLWLLARRAEPERRPLDLRAVAWFAFLGMVGVYAPQGLILVGVHLAGPEPTAFLQPTIPVYVALLTWATGSERLSPGKALGVAAAVSGALVMLDFGHLDLTSGKGAGVLVVLLQVLSYAVFIVCLPQHLASDPRPFTVCAWASTFGALALTVTAAPTMRDVDWGSVPMGTWATLAYCCLGVSVCAHASVVWAVKFVDATVPSLYVCLQPLCVAVLAAIVYGDALDLRDVLGVALIVPGVLATVWAKWAEGRSRVEAGSQTGGEAEVGLEMEHLIGAGEVPRDCASLDAPAAIVEPPLVTEAELLVQ